MFIEQFGSFNLVISRTTVGKGLLSIVVATQNSRPEPSLYRLLLYRFDPGQEQPDSGKMGADGGSIPDRSDLVKTKARDVKLDKAHLRELFFFCALSKRLLSKPVVLDPLGKLYNKDAVLEYFLDRSKYGDGDQICGYLKGVKDLLTVNLTDNPEYSPPSSSTTAQTPLKAPFVCPLSLKEMSGAVPFIALRSCGCVFSDASIRAIIPNLTKGLASKAVTGDEKPDEAKSIVSKEGGMVVCPNCAKEFDPTKPNAIQPIYPTKEVQELLLDHLLATRAAAKSSKKRKAAAALMNADTNGENVVDGVHEVKIPRKSSPVLDRRRDIDTNGDRSREGSQARKERVANGGGNGSGRASPMTNPNNVGRSVHQKLAEQEQKRLAAQAGMSDAVKSMFKPKTKGDEKKSGASDFFGRTFTRYA